MVRRLGVVTRSVAIKLKGSGESPPPWDIGVRSRQIHVISDYFLYLLHPQLICMRTGISVDVFTGALEKTQ